MTTTEPTAREALEALLPLHLNGDDCAQLLDAYRDQVRTEAAERIVPPWEASYDSATFTPRLLAYCNDLSAAKGAAEAWLRSQVEDATGLTWVPDQQMAVGEWDQWFELVRDNPYGDGIVDTEIVVRRRAARTGQEG